MSNSRMERYQKCSAVMDWFSRRVLSWRVSITMEAAFCIEALEEALARHGNPQIFNTDQGSQFTCHSFTDVLVRNPRQGGQGFRRKADSNPMIADSG